MKLQKNIYKRGNRIFIKKTISNKNNEKKQVDIYVSSVDDGVKTLKEMEKHDFDYDYCMKLSEDSKKKHNVLPRGVRELKNIFNKNGKWIVEKTINNKTCRWVFENKTEAVTFRNYAQRRDWNVSVPPQQHNKSNTKYEYGRFEEKYTVKTKKSKNKDKQEVKQEKPFLDNVINKIYSTSVQGSERTEKITIPREIVKAYHLDCGDYLSWKLVKDDDTSYLSVNKYDELNNVEKYGMIKKSKLYWMNSASKTLITTIPKIVSDEFGLMKHDNISWVHQEIKGKCYLILQKNNINSEKVKKKSLHKELTINYEPLKDKTIIELADKYDTKYNDMVDLLIQIGIMNIQRLNFTTQYGD